MFISIQQPEYFPWLGYFDKLIKVDKVIFLDNVQFKKRYFENRNKIRTAEGSTWLMTPVKTKGLYKQSIKDVIIDNTQPWQRKIINSITLNYRKSPFWNEIGDELCELVDLTWDRLLDFNLAIILFFMKKLDIEREWCLSSSLGTSSSGKDLILEICEKENAKCYLSGRDGKKYLDELSFEEKNISIIYQDFIHPEYCQFQGGFESFMSIADLYFNYGSGSLKLFKG